MDENMKKEIENGASVLEITQEDAMAKYEDLCQQNGIETSDRLGLGLWRNFVANAKRSKKEETILPLLPILITRRPLVSSLH